VGRRACCLKLMSSNALSDVNRQEGRSIPPPSDWTKRLKKRGGLRGVQVSLPDRASKDLSAQDRREKLGLRISKKNAHPAQGGGGGGGGGWGGGGGGEGGGGGGVGGGGGGGVGGGGGGGGEKCDRNPVGGKGESG